MNAIGPIAMNQIGRPLLRWHGGKWKLAPWIISHMPPHRCYVEPFGGAASVLLRKPRAVMEVYNDLESNVVTLFRVLRDPEQAAALHRRLSLTPFARDEFEASYLVGSDPVEIASRLVVRCFMGFGSNAAREDCRSGFRGNRSSSGRLPAQDWSTHADALPAIVERMRGVVIENHDAIACVVRYDTPATLHYVDPPYILATRSRKHPSDGYKHELTEADHTRLLGELVRLQGMVLVSGYPHELYDTTLRGWRRVERQTYADGARPRTEVLWLNSAAQEASSQRTLFCKPVGGGDSLETRA